MYKHYISGELISGEGKPLEVINPATEEIAGNLNYIDINQAEKALKSAEKAFNNWSSLSLNERGKWIKKIAEAITDRRDQILDILMSETGKPLANAIYDYEMLVDCLYYFMEEARRLTGSIIPDYDNMFHNYIIREPIGVVVGYLAWNFPLLNLGYKLGPILASGCTCVIKPSSKTPLASLYIGQIAAEIGFPEGVINIISGSSREVGTYLNKSNIPRMITLIGSSSAGKTIIGQSSTSIKRYSLELGGNAPVIIMPDADIEKAAEEIVNLKFNNAGQVCVSPNRVFVHESIYEQFIKLVKKNTEEISLGWGRDESAQMGPIISLDDRDRILDLIEKAISSGAESVCGGTIPQDKEKGYFLNPTVLKNVTPEMEVASKEIFGPVMPILKFNDKDEVIKEANNTEYGLAAYVFAENNKDIFDIAEALEFGSVSVNEPFYAVNLPHGGLKESGIGKDCSVYSLEEYYYIKRISIKN